MLTIQGPEQILILNLRFLIMILIISFFASSTPKVDAQNILQAKITIKEIYGRKTSDILMAKELHIGDSCVGVIEIWPIQSINFDSNFYEIKKDFENQTILGLFYVSDIKNISISVNNNEVLLIEANLVLLKNFANFDFHILKIKNLEISTLIENNFNITNDSTDQKQVSFSDLKYIRPTVIYDNDVSFNKKIILFMLLLSVIAGSIFLINMLFLYYKKNRAFALEVLHWKDLFEKKIIKREDLELIYKNKSKWIPLIKNYSKHQNNIEQFFSILNSHQYKKNWDQHVYNEITGAFERIRYIWSNNFNKVIN